MQTLLMIFELSLYRLRVSRFTSNANTTTRNQNNNRFFLAGTFAASYTVHERSPGARVRYVAFCEDVDPEHARAVAAKGAAY